MITKKLLMGGTAAVGSVTTVAVAANQFGFPYASKVTKPKEKAGSNREQLIEERSEEPKEQEEDEKTIQEEIEQSRKEVKDWLEKNKGENNWQIKIRENYEDKEIEESNTSDLDDFLKSQENIKLLKLLTSEGTTTTFIFEWSDNGWKNIFTVDQILAWVKNTSGGKATLKINEEDEVKELGDEHELDKFFEFLKDKESLFTGLKEKDEITKKTILFELNGSDWKHYKEEIDDWLKDTHKGVGDNKFEIKIKKDGKDATAFDSTNEDELIGLLDYLSSEETKSTLLGYKNPIEDQKTPLTLEKKQDGWKLIYEDMINDLISNTSENKAKLELYDNNGSKKELSEINNDDELKELFGDLIEEEVLKLFREKLDGYNEKSPKIIVLEKYENNWTHVKKAIEEFLKEKAVSYKLKIQVNGSPAEINDDKIKDNELIGLLKHLREPGNNYENESGDLILENKDGGWKKVTAK